jgi:hypothetical protein
VATAVQGAPNCTLADLERLDGTVIQLPRELFKQILIRRFPSDETETLLSLYEKSYDRKMVLAAGDECVRYDSGTAILSGMPCTSLLGTITSTFSIYVGLRTTKRADGEFYSKDDAWLKLCTRCCASGDDVLMGDVSPETLRKGAKSIGLISDAYDVKNGEPGVVFLSRAYSPEVWNGCLNSMTCPKRQLSKFHTTTKIAGVTPEEKLKEKARAYLLTDANTPVLGAFCRRVETICGPLLRNPKTAMLERWQSDLDRDTQYPNEYGEWMDDMFENELPAFDTRGFHAHLSTVRTVEQLLNMPLFIEQETPKVKAPVVVDDDLLLPKESDEGGAWTKVEKKKKKTGGVKAKPKRKQDGSTNRGNHRREKLKAN